ncbi:hypothetical protein EDD22DRAFT_849400 [Suillus occidentalis]|nr:hypothetical protein EDD22DRAFT_849400 [Suillus occidentalis]
MFLFICVLLLSITTLFLLLAACLGLPLASLPSHFCGLAYRVGKVQYITHRPDKLSVGYPIVICVWNEPSSELGQDQVVKGNDKSPPVCKKHFKFHNTVKKGLISITLQLNEMNHLRSYSYIFPMPFMDEDEYD